MNESTISNRPRTLLANILSLFLTVILLIVAAFLWRSQTESKDQLEALSVQNSRLQENLEAARKEIDNLSSGDSSIATRERLEANSRSATPKPVMEETETLFLQTPTVEQTSEGLVVRFGFEPEPDADLPESITLVVRVPRSSGSKIAAFKAATAREGANITSVISPNQDLCLIEGSPEALGSLSFELIVTEPVTAIIRGSEGILDFEMDITPQELNLRQL